MALASAHSSAITATADLAQPVFVAATAATADVVAPVFVAATAATADVVAPVFAAAIAVAIASCSTSYCRPVSCNSFMQ